MYLNPCNSRSAAVKSNHIALPQRRSLGNGSRWPRKWTVAPASPSHRLFCCRASPMITPQHQCTHTVDALGPLHLTRVLAVQRYGMAPSDSPIHSYLHPCAALLLLFTDLILCRIHKPNIQSLPVPYVRRHATAQHFSSSHHHHVCYPTELVVPVAILY